MKRLLLFDIDGTLLDTAGIGKGALLDAMRTSFPDEVGVRGLPDLDLRGTTDAAVIRLLFSVCSVPDSEANRSRFIRSYLDHLCNGLASPGRNGVPRTLPGVEALLALLSARPDQFVLGLLTGNLEDGAFAKLRHFRLHDYFRFGAFGLDREHRDELGPVALERARVATGLAFTPLDTVVIGDTPRDIQCARAFGARCIAVATGGTAAGVIARHHPDALLPDLADHSGFLAAIGDSAN